MHYIYCYTNKLNQHKYVGQTNNLQRRVREHRSCAFNEKTSSYNDLIHKKIRQYGEENFEITTLEILYTDDLNIVNEREQYWIEKLNTYCGNGQGYNMDLGGGQKKSSKLTTEEIQDIKNMLKQNITYIDIQSKYNIRRIKIGESFFDEKLSYPLGTCNDYPSEGE